MAHGVRPYDAESCYRAFDDDALIRGCRWGDYSAARADTQDRIWMATKYIPDLPEPRGPTGAPSSAGWRAATREDTTCGRHPSRPRLYCGPHLGDDGQIEWSRASINSVTCDLFRVRERRVVMATCGGCANAAGGLG
jgi:hypothetical protein